MKKELMIKLAAVAALLLVAALAAAEEGYPLRAKFPGVTWITTQQLDREYQKTIIVDVRSKTEFDVIHINKAVHVPITTALFVKQLEAVREKNGSETIAFYCNGHTCAKSYEAVEEAAKAGFHNVVAFDSGIHDWVKVQPGKTTLMGSSPAPLEKLIPAEMLAKRKIDFAEFKQRAGNPDVVVIDAREPFQRKEIPALSMLRNIPSDRLVELIAKGEFRDKQLLILDAVGKQVEWIQYYLEQHGHSDYFFLDKGVAGAAREGSSR
jgi:rhodanese-related sulfurtransferase